MINIILLIIIVIIGALLLWLLFLIILYLFLGYPTSVDAGGYKNFLWIHKHKEYKPELGADDGD